MKNIKSISLDFVKGNYAGVNAQRDYIYIPDFRAEAFLSEPYRSNYFCMGFVKKGELILETNLFTHKIKGPALIFADFTPVKRWDKTHKDYEAESLLFSEFFLQEKLPKPNFISTFSDLLSPGAYVAELTEEDARNVETLFQIIGTNSIDLEGFYRKEIIRGVAYSLVNIIAELYIKTGGISREVNRLERKFRKAVSEYGREHHDVKFYANLLHVHPKYLSQIITFETGRTAREWIQQQIIIEAKVLLQNQDLTFSEIAEILHFPDQSSFGKYFKRYTKISPSTYRHSPDFIKKKD